MSNPYPIEVIESTMRKRNARATRLPTAGTNHRLAHKATPTKLCTERKASRKPSECVTITP